MALQQLTPVLHLITLLWCGGAIVAFLAVGRAAHSQLWSRRLELAVGGIGLGLWIFKVSWYSWPPADGNLYIPLHLCNLSELACCLSLLTRWMWLQPLVYFWALGALQAFVTPQVRAGPGQVAYWLFWLPLTLIVGVALYEVIVARFRPTLRDVGIAVGATLLYLAVVFPINIIFGTNFGYVGPSKPGVPSLIDFLGPWPLRVVWMILLGLILFALVWLPWALMGRKGFEHHSVNEDERKPQNENGVSLNAVHDENPK